MRAGKKRVQLTSCSTGPLRQRVHRDWPGQTGFAKRCEIARHLQIQF